MTSTASFSSAHSPQRYSNQPLEPESFPRKANDSVSVTDTAMTKVAARSPSYLSRRDLAVLASLHSCRLLTTGQVQRLHITRGTPTSRQRRAQMLLRKLLERGLVVRLGRHVGATRRGYVFGLTGRGLAALGVSGPYGKRRRVVWHGKPYFQDHLLAVAETYVQLVEHCRIGSTELMGFDTEPNCWRRFMGVGGAPHTLKPDGLARVGIGRYELHSFIEVDLGTESLPTIQRKCQMYLRYCRSGLEQQAHGVFPRVVWLVPDERRVEGIARELQRLRQPEASRLFTVALHARGPAILTTLPEAAGDAS